MKRQNKEKENQISKYGRDIGDHANGKRGV